MLLNFWPKFGILHITDINIHANDSNIIWRTHISNTNNVASCTFTILLNIYSQHRKLIKFPAECFARIVPGMPNLVKFSKHIFVSTRNLSASTVWNAYFFYYFIFTCFWKRVKKAKVSSFKNLYCSCWNEVSKYICQKHIVYTVHVDIKSVTIFGKSIIMYTFILKWSQSQYLQNNIIYTVHFEM